VYLQHGPVALGRALEDLALSGIEHR
jgi:hypothetical protein